MPSIVTHHLFGRQVYAELEAVIRGSDDQTSNSNACKDAFLLGNIGPDPLFCMKVLPRRTPFRTLGSIMHIRRPAQLLATFHEQFIECASNAERGGAAGSAETAQGKAAQSDMPNALKAYALGFLCHYLLDSTVHPLVNAQKIAYCKAGGEGMSRSLVGGSVHALIETELDEYLLTKMLGVTVNEFVPHRETLPCAARELNVISEHFAKAASQAYGFPVPNWLFAESVRIYRLAQHSLDAKRDGVRSHFDYARVVGKHYLHVLALSHSARLRPETPFANDDHLPFPHPYEEGKVVDASFDELYDQAFRRALETIPQFARADFSPSDCAALANNTNFSGERI